jgi:uncharacterized integral membrane protein
VNATQPTAAPSGGLRGLFRKYWWVVMTILVGGHLVAWTVKNPQPVKVNWVFFGTTTPVVVVIVVAALLGCALTLLVQHKRRRS